MAGAFQNPGSPDVPTHQGDGVGERQRLLDASRPADHSRLPLAFWQFREPQRDQRVKSEQTGLGAQDRLRRTSARRFDSDMLASLLERDLDRPATSISLDDLLRREVDVGGEEVLVAVIARQVFDEDPADGDQSFDPLYQCAVAVTTATCRRPPPYHETLRF